MLTADSIGASIPALFAFVIGGVLYRSGQRAPTDESKYIYSPARSPTMRTPKHAFAVAAWAVGLEMAALGFHAYVHPSHAHGASPISAQAMRVLDPLDNIVSWVTLALLIGALGWLIWTTQPAGQDVHDDTEPPIEGDRDKQD